VLADDGGECSFHITRIYAGTETHIHYKNHFESVYCIEGEGEVETLADGKIWPIKPGDIYILDQHDEHLLRATKTMHLACVFTPGLTGKEVKEAAKPHLPEALFPGGKTAGWWAKTVQLDLEARGLMARSASSPLRFWRTGNGAD